MREPAHGIHSIRRQVIRRLSNLQPPDAPDEAVRRRPRKASIDASSPPTTPTAPTTPPTKTKRKTHAHAHTHAQNGHPRPPKNDKQKQIDWEIPRKALHSSIGFLTLFLYLSHTSPRPVTRVLWAALAVIVPADVLRLRSPRFARVYERALGFLMRESEKRATNGVIWYILGVNFALSVYPLDIAVVSILILSWADTAASTIGRLFGAYTPPLPRALLRLPLAPRKSLAGFLAACVTGAGVTLGFWGWVAPLGAGAASWRWDGGWGAGAVVGLVAGLVTGVAEALDLGDWDDNLTLPIISGGCLFGFFKVLGMFSS